MGTRGCCACRFRGRYYIRYNGHDSFPEYLGRRLVASIPEDPEEFQKWLQEQRSKHAVLDELLDREVLCVRDADLQDATSPFMKAAQTLRETFLDDKLSRSGLPCYIPPANDSLISYTYVLDLDRQIFTIDNGAHFKMPKIPRDCWTKSLHINSVGERYIDPCRVAHDVIANFHYQLPLGYKVDSTCALLDVPLNVVTTKGFNRFPMSIQHGPLFLLSLWKIFKTSHSDTVKKTLPMPNDLYFREIIFGIISLAAGLTGTLITVDERRLLGNERLGWKALSCGKNCREPNLLVAEFGMGCHLESFEPGSCPPSVDGHFWFRGVLVSIQSNLRSEAILQAELAKSVAYGRRTKSDAGSFDILLISLEHAVIVRVFSAQIQCTKLLPLLTIPVHPPDNDSGFCSSQGGDGDESVLERYRVSPIGQVPTIEYEDRGASSTFMTLIHMFEGAAKQTLKPENLNEGVFPEEIYQLILQYTDQDTWKVCLTVSRKFRRLCQQRIHLGEGFILRGAVFSETDISKLTPLEVGEEPKGGKFNAKLAAQLYKDRIRNYRVYKKISGTGDYVHQESPDKTQFVLHDTLANEVSSHLLVRPGSSGTGWQAICGEGPRLSSIVKFCFSGLYFNPRTLPQSPSRRPRSSGRPVSTRPCDTASDNNRSFVLKRYFEELNSDGNSPIHHVNQLWSHAITTIFQDTSGLILSHLHDVGLLTHARTFVATPTFDVYLYVEYTRPGSFVSTSEIWDRCEEEAQIKIQKIASAQQNQKLFCMIVVETSTVPFAWDAQEGKVKRRADSPLSICSPHDCKAIKKFLWEVDSAVPFELRKDGKSPVPFDPDDGDRG